MKLILQPLLDSDLDGLREALGPRLAEFLPRPDGLIWVELYTTWKSVHTESKRLAKQYGFRVV